MGARFTSLRFGNRSERKPASCEAGLRFSSVAVGRSPKLPELRSSSHLLVRLPAFFVLLFELRVEFLGLVGKALHEAGVTHFAHEKVVEVAGWLLRIELERLEASAGEIDQRVENSPFLLLCGPPIACGQLFRHRLLSWHRNPMVVSLLHPFF